MLVTMQAGEVTRRAFLLLLGAAAAMPGDLRAESAVPPDLDHILLGVDQLERGIAWVEQRTGVRAALGGVHPGRGTQNALLALGPGRYLEIIAPDPKQPLLPPAQPLAGMREPRLFHWAVHTEDMALAAKRVADAGFATEGVAAGSRARPDGKTLSWQTCRLKENREGLLPFFIHWSQGSTHPSADAPPGCTLTRFHLESPAAGEMARECKSLGVEVSVLPGKGARLRALITGPRGQVEI